MGKFFCKRPGPCGLAVWILIVLGVHLFLRSQDVQPRLWGDEPMYAQNAVQDAQAGQTSLLPGRLPFRTRPEFSTRVLANLGPEQNLQASASLLNILLLVLTLAMLYGQARLLGLRAPFALLASVLLGSFPWYGFHVHSLWPEILHGALSSAVLLGVLAAMHQNQLRYLIGAGVLAAIALLTKGVLQPFVLLFALGAGFAFWRQARAAGSRAPWRRGLLASGLLLGSCLATLAPQWITNHGAGHGYRLAANRWWNLELGLLANPRQGRSVGKLQNAYFAASPRDEEREALAEERTWTYLEQAGLWTVLGDQSTKFKRLLFEHESSLERSLGKMQRWGPEPPAGLQTLASLGRLLWFALLTLGGLGAAWLWRRSLGWFLVSSAALGFCGAAFLIPLKVRFLMPMVPFLVLLASGLLQLVRDRLRPAKSPASAQAP